MRPRILNCLSVTVCALAVSAYFLDQTWATDAQPEDNLPGKVIHSWLANSFATEAGTSRYRSTCAASG